MSLSDAGSIQEFPVFSYSIRYLAYFDESHGQNGSGRIRPDPSLPPNQREVHQRLVAQGWTDEMAYSTMRFTFLNKRMLRVAIRDDFRRKLCTLHLALQVLADKLLQLSSLS